MSSRCRCAAAIIASSIAVVMKRPGGKMLALIRPLLPARCGWRRTRCPQERTKWEANARPPWLASPPQNGKRGRPLSKRDPNDETKPISTADRQ